MVKLVILDRDGVINEDSDDFIKTPDEWVPIPGSLEAIARLNSAGYRVVVITNQSGIARGLFDTETLISIHDKMHNLLAEMGGEVEAVLFCPHGPKDDCSCRKPRGGMFKQLASRLGIDLNGVPAVGDSGRDLEAAASAGALPVLVRSGKGERTLASGISLEAIPLFENLAAFVDSYLAEEG
ncbi:D-glycero-beta-D-manno-heptose-1,7-bisphosphate 7-phosphatase [Solemya pervernicosa gill symbiont]|uniref:D,D-heptose 1,7-bisphosphate phosphatase n=2 Tax=Gammaproteobacteria incertae sedis TaxID=118884 RepID=A0A1T2L4R8_9GAMM|nr:D-glycero-beta-D-manno-heptose 1,7-bisphosphate 7-phosphatase [Candidatus Reidiella endopervernicosa]OOZ40093.1 D-glycero-beta-D-manno-heptose-1,7-bisphosphate 7-phosphatase [Solemya pervernicosa gill symbiont]QKQ25409.1 D-glycero-beta-D-manno-heptose 1,7-bisphosphate 7-phosphatase [Candidatus Reidiella endopervernicosa]